MKNETELLSISQAADFLGKSIITLRRWDSQNKIPFQLTEGGHRRYAKDDLLKFSQSLPQIPPRTHAVNTFIFDFDSTLFPGETLDEVLELALSKSPDRETRVKQIQEICDKGMNGELDLTQSLAQRLDLADITQTDIDQYISRNLNRITAEMRDTLELLQEKKQQIFIVSGGFREWIVPLAAQLGITPDRVQANSFKFSSTGNVQGFIHSNPLSTSNGKATVIAGLKSAGRTDGDTFLIGDGASDLAAYTSKEVDYFLGYGVHKTRKLVAEQASYFFRTHKDFSKFIEDFLS